MASMSVAPLQHRGALERRAHRGGGRLVGVVNEAARLTSSIGCVSCSRGENGPVTARGLVTPTPCVWGSRVQTVGHQATPRRYEARRRPEHLLNTYNCSMNTR